MITNVFPMFRPILKNNRRIGAILSNLSPMKFVGQIFQSNSCPMNFICQKKIYPMTFKGMTMIVKQVDQSTLSNELFEGHLRKFVQANLSNNLLEDLLDDFYPTDFYWTFIGSERFIY